MCKISVLSKVLINILHILLDCYAVLTNDWLLSKCNAFFRIRKSKKGKA